MDEKRKKRQIAKISVFITSVFVIFLSVTYAFINMTVTGTKRQVITSGNLQIELEEDNAITLTNAIPTYDEVGMIQDSFNFRLVNKTSEDTNYIVKLVDITDASKEKLDTSIVKYGLTKDGVSTTNLLSTLTDNQIDSGTINGNQTIHYSLRLWINSTVTDNNSIKDKMLSYRIDAEVRQDGYIAQSIVFDTVANDSGELCGVYDDGVDSILAGQCSKNYVWYSGKLWRVVLKNNETGAVKMVTDNAMTSIYYNTAGNSNFENSYADQWLQQEFLPTLHDYEDYLVVDSVWNNALYSEKIVRPDESFAIKRTVGLLNSYEFAAALYAGNIATMENVYLNNQAAWYFITPYNQEKIIGSSDTGQMSIYTIKNETRGLGIRPAVNLKGTIQISGGNGSIDNPYRLVGDEQEIINGTTLLNTGYSGNYIRFDNDLYRIVGVENNLVKITAVAASDKVIAYATDRPNTLNYDQSNIKNELEKYYQSLDSQWKIMIQPNTVWYLGNFSMDSISYKLSICSVADSNVSTASCPRTTVQSVGNIGLPRVGELFTSQISRGNRRFFWLLQTFYTNSLLAYEILANGELNCDSAISGYSRPSMYLKSNVVIASTNTGDGTYEHPYDIELGQE